MESSVTSGEVRCVNHCEHDLRWMGQTQDGLRCLAIVSPTSFRSHNCGHRCKYPAEPATISVGEPHFDNRSVDPRLIPEKWLSDVKFFDHIQGTSSVCTWECEVCFQRWDSNAKLPCPRCRPNWKDELAALLGAREQLLPDQLAAAQKEIEQLTTKV